MVSSSRDQEHGRCLVLLLLCEGKRRLALVVFEVGVGLAVKQSGDRVDIRDG